MVVHVSGDASLVNLKLVNCQGLLPKNSRRRRVTNEAAEAFHSLLTPQELVRLP